MGKELAAVLFAWLSLVATGQPTHTSGFKFQFHCNTGYTERSCEAQLMKVKQVLATMDLTGLGEWTWVLVRSEDWTEILRRVNRDPDSPAFTILEKRQTFLEEALFTCRADRCRRLLEKWRVPLDALLPFAVTHELAHALCREADERRTHEYAEQLRATGAVRCSITEGSNASASSVGRPPRSQRGGREFEPPAGHQNASKTRQLRLLFCCTEFRDHVVDRLKVSSAGIRRLSVGCVDRSSASSFAALLHTPAITCAV
jgi:hypothetical protein